MSDNDQMPGKGRMTVDPSVEALAANRQMFLGFLVKRLGNLTEAEDVLQDFCLSVMNRKDQLRDSEQLNA